MLALSLIFHTNFINDTRVEYVATIVASSTRLCHKQLKTITVPVAETKEKHGIAQRG